MVSISISVSIIIIIIISSSSSSRSSNTIVYISIGLSLSLRVWWTPPGRPSRGGPLARLQYVVVCYSIHMLDSSI